MTSISHGLYLGSVVHKRMRPRAHALRYSVFSCLFDCDQIGELDARLRLFSYNRFNLFSLHDRDHTDGRSLGEYLRSIAERSGRGGEVSRFMMLCYPRVLGYVFNPLTVYFGLNTNDCVRLVVYEVRNTFGERKTYVLPAEPDENGLVDQQCRKRFYVSPFNAVEGRYSFHTTPLGGDDLTVGVALKTDAGPVLKAHFRGKRQPLSDRTLIRALARTGWMTVKVIAGIHIEALKLCAKGLRVVKRPPAPATPVTYIAAPKESMGR
jgi:DUF1365 family protein